MQTADIRRRYLQFFADREAELRTGTGLDAPLPAGGQVPLPARRGAHSAE